MSEVQILSPRLLKLQDLAWRNPQAGFLFFVAGALLSLWSLFFSLPTFLLDLFLCAALLGGVGTLTTRPSSLPGLLVSLAVFRVGVGLSLVRGALSASGAALTGAVGRSLPSAAGVVLVLVAALSLGLLLARAAARAAEVSARFTLDALPGAQAALEAEPKNPFDPLQAKEAREALLEEARWRGAADGAAKILPGDALLAPLFGVAVALLPLIEGQAAEVAQGSGVALLLLAAALPPAASLAFGVVSLQSRASSFGPLLGVLALLPLLLVPGAPLGPLLLSLALCLLLFWVRPPKDQDSAFMVVLPSLPNANALWQEALVATQTKFGISLPKIAVSDQRGADHFQLTQAQTQLSKAGAPQQALEEALPRLFGWEEARAFLKQLTQEAPTSARLIVLPLPVISAALQQTLSDGLPLVKSAILEALVRANEKTTSQELSDKIRAALAPLVLRSLGEPPVPVVRLEASIEDQLRKGRPLDAETLEALLQKRDELSSQTEKRPLVLMCHKDAREEAARLLRAPGWRFVAPEEVPAALEIDFLGELTPG